jgi:DASS family divalent anion:Na+ symporter
VITNGMPIFHASILALPVAVLSGVLEPVEAFAGFGKGFILLIVVAFLVARGFVKSGLGHRIAWLVIARFGRSSLGLAYSLFLTDLLIAPAFPSNTARSGVLFPIAQALAIESGSRPEDGTRGKVGTFLMLVCMAGLSVSSALWLTAMAANPAGAELAARSGVTITFGSWLVAASVPCAVATLVLPRLIYRICTPDVRETPEAPAAARAALRELGPMTRAEWITLVTFVSMVLLWALAGVIGADATAVAFAGLFALMFFGVFELKDLRKEGGTLEVFIWFAILFALSTSLNEKGFMTWLGGHVAELVEGLPALAVYAVLVGSYVLIHYLFVSQTAQMFALFPVYLGVGIGAGLPPTLVAYALLFATNYFSMLTPQASSANVIFVSSGYVTTDDVYRVGGLVTLANVAIFGILGGAWIVLVA